MTGGANSPQHQGCRGSLLGFDFDSAFQAGLKLNRGAGDRLKVQRNREALEGLLDLANLSRYVAGQPFKLQLSGLARTYPASRRERESGRDFVFRL